MQLKNLFLSFPHKTCFKEFSTIISAGSRIAIIGRNGSGKSTLLRMIYENFGNETAFVPQVIEDFQNLSGGQRFNKKLSEQLGKNSSILLLDEPTNHLDVNSRRSLIRMINKFSGTVIVVTHDLEVLRNCVDTLWHITDGEIKIFSGNYDDYMRELQQKKISLQDQKESIKLQQKKLQLQAQKNQEHAAKSKAAGEKKIQNKRWTKVVGNLKISQAQKADGKKNAKLIEANQNLSDQLQEIFIPEMLTPKFNLSGDKKNSCVTIVNGFAGYSPEEFIVKNINISTNENFAIVGNNGSGKTTLVRAILSDPLIFKKGDWYVPKNIGYVDQHYSILDKKISVFETIKNIAPNWSDAEVRRHLNDFLFRKNEEIELTVGNLSGGELARLCMARIAACPPTLLILDEITNNIDLETRNHIVEVLNVYESQFIVISHDEKFLEEIGIAQFIDLDS